MGKAKRNPETGKMQPTGDYRNGFAKPPEASRFKPGQSGNPSGRGKGSRNVANEIKDIVEKEVEFLDNDKKRRISLVAANLLAHAAKGAKGDVRSATLFLNQARALGLLGPTTGEPNDLGQNVTRLPSPSRPSEVLTQNLDLNLISREEQIELSRLSEIIDLGGDFTALSGEDFARLKYLIDKGRGKDVTPN